MCLVILRFFYFQNLGELDTTSTTPHEQLWLRSGDEIDAPETQSGPILIDCNLADGVEAVLLQDRPAIVAIEVARVFFRRALWIGEPQQTITGRFRATFLTAATTSPSSMGSLEK